MVILAILLMVVGAAGIVRYGLVGLFMVTLVGSSKLARQNVPGESVAYLKSQITKFITGIVVLGIGFGLWSWESAAEKSERDAARQREEEAFTRLAAALQPVLDEYSAL